MALGAPVLAQVEEVFHGVTVVDPYRWLEDRGSIQTEDWIASQQRRLDMYFSRVPQISTLRTRVSQFLNVDVIDQVAHLGGRYFYRRQEKNREQACIWVRDMATGQERTLVDPNEQGQFVSARIHSISDNGQLLAYEVKHGGEDTRAIQIVEVETGRTLPEQVDTGHARGFAFASDNAGFYYCHETAGERGDHTIRFCRFGRLGKQNPVIFRMARTPWSRLALVSDECRLGATYVHECGSDLGADFYLASRDQDEQWKCVFTNKVPLCAAWLTRKRILQQTEDGAPNGRIIELSETGVLSRVIVPESEDRIQQLSSAGENLYVGYLVRGETVVRVYTLSGEYLESIPLPGAGSVRLLPSYGNRSDSLFYIYESFTKPPTIFKYGPENRQSEVWARPCVCLGRSRHHIRRSRYRSKDGTEIPITLVMRKEVEPANDQPAILTGYGGFGVSMTPQFSVLVAIMLKLGAVFALPNIRGGSEFGKAWHEAARRRNRQVAVDDFISAAEWLCEQRVTSPHKLAIFGGSNSGLLVGAAMTQRPDLFRAVLCIAPLLDMVRYELFGQARKLQVEYGTVNDSGDFHALYAYSPYHHLDENVNYPSTLFVSGDMDDRCNPAHVRKMAARLQNRTAQTNPILVDYSRERGHSPVLPLSIRIEALTRRVAFLCHELNIPVLDGDSL
jgi:prolyl oligopeptidase